MDRRLIRLALGIAALAVLVVIALRPSVGGPGPTASPTPGTSAASGSPSPSVSSSASADPGTSASGSPSGSLPPTPTPPPTAPPPTPSATPVYTGADVAGTWTGTWQVDQPAPAEGALRFDLSQAGPELSGTVTFDGNACLVEGPVQGFVDGDRVELAVTLRDEIEFDGTLAGEVLAGDLSIACDGSSGTFRVTAD